jgi:O-glycosyl hydrolase
VNRLYRLSLGILIAGILLPGGVPAFSHQVFVDPKAVEVESWEGWGCSLSWWAVYSRHWSEERRREVCRRLFSRDADSLGLNIARYNAGGTAPDADEKPFRYGGKVAVILDRDGGWHPERDQAQIACLLLARRYGANRFELFVNSPPYWMLRNGNTRGADNGSENLREDSLREYAHWLIQVTRKLEETYRIPFRYIAPFNEPSAWWWNSSTSRQEGCHIPWRTQAQILRHLREAIDSSRKPYQIAASNENGAADGYKTLSRLISPEDSAGGGAGLDRRFIQKLNVHAYHGWDWQDRLRELAHRHGIAHIWMAEVSHREWGEPGFVPNSMRCALPTTRSIVSDIKRLRCSAWVYWQAVEPLQYNLWYNYTYGLLPVGVDRPVEWNGKTYQPGEFVIAKSFYAFMQFTRFICPGDRLVRSGDDWTLAAVSPGRRQLTLVVHNDTDQAKPYMFDLSRFSRIGSRVKVWRTAEDEGEEKHNCRPLPALNVKERGFTDTVPARSVTTYVVEGVRE